MATQIDPETGNSVATASADPDDADIDIDVVARDEVDSEKRGFFKRGGGVLLGGLVAGAIGLGLIVTAPVSAVGVAVAGSFLLAAGIAGTVAGGVQLGVSYSGKTTVEQDARNVEALHTATTFPQSPATIAFGTAGLLVGGDEAGLKTGVVAGQVAELATGVGALARWTATRAGLLADAYGFVGRGRQVLTAAEANAPHIAKGWQPPYSSAEEVVDVVLDAEAHLVRLHGESNPYGAFLAHAEDIKGLTPEQIRDVYSLPEVPTLISDVVVEAGTTVRTGLANPLAGWGGGLGRQFEVIGKHLPKSSFTNTRPLAGG